LKKIERVVEAKFNPKVFTVDVLLTMLGTFVFAVAVHVFTAPNHIAPGGVTGIATILNYKTSLPIGIITIVLNIPIVVLGVFYLGRWFMVKTFVSIVTFTLAIDYILVNAPTYSGNVIVAALFGGVLMGAGLGLVTTRVSSSGGTDVINRIIARKIPSLKLGTITFLTDMVVIAISGLVYKQIEPVLFAIITLYVSARALDTVLYGFNVCRLMYIITDKPDEVVHCINTQLNKGATIFDSLGAYTRQKKPTIMCAVRRNQYVRLKRFIATIDPNAFIIITSANEIVGSGFKSNDL